ncbi:MAG: hypothetical protein U0V74_02615 [Chitinophagales bacterium]
MRVFVIALITACLVYSCGPNPNDNETESFGVIDTTAIASDTAMQLGMESSYEYFKSHQWTPKDVYDVTAWGKPDSGEYCIIYRGASNNKDTVAIGKRYGKIYSSWLTDLNSNKKPELIFAYGNGRTMQQVIAYEFAEANQPVEIKYEPRQLTTGGDSVYINQATKELIQVVADRAYHYTLRENHFSLKK